MNKEIKLDVLPLVYYKSLSEVYCVVSYGEEIFLTPDYAELRTFLMGFYSALGLPSSTVKYLISVHDKHVGKYHLI